MKKTILILLIFCFTNSVFSQKSNIKVEFNETYELANIILALTEYGKTDKSEVTKNTKYYNDVISYFSPFFTHPLFEKVNYSREKWAKLLSFRTDAIAFQFNDNNSITRISKFYSMGKEINEFENNIGLIEDFAIKSHFRDFYKSKELFFDSLKKMYQESLMIPEIISFLQDEFSIKPKSQFTIMISPLVGRMHCQRNFENIPTSFINIPKYLYSIKNVSEIKKEDIAENLHMLFTEIDHDFINPTTKKYKKEYVSLFTPSKWDKNSGYAESKYATFNEYMTWAVYDLFIHKYFPDLAEKESKEWHEVNESRGFFASTIFGEKLYELYKNKEPDQKVKDIYPALLNWCKEVENDLESLTSK